jgi:chorismate mutase
MKKKLFIIILFFLTLFNSFNLKAQEKGSDLFDPIIKKIKETFVALLKSLKPSEDQKKEAQGIMNEIKGYYDILKQSIPNLPPSQKDQEELKLLRNQIDNLDDLSTNLLSFIMDEAPKIADFKRKNDLPAFTLEQWNDILRGKFQFTFLDKLKNVFSSDNLSDFDKQIQELIIRELQKVELNQLEKIIPSKSSANKEKIKNAQEKIVQNYNKLKINLASRMEVIKKIGQWKKKHNEVSFQKARWKEVLKDRKNKGAIKGLSKDFMETFMNTIHLESLKIQEKIIQKS